MAANLGRVIVRKTTVIISGNEASSFLTSISGRRPQRGKVTSTKALIRLITNTTRIRIDAGDKDVSVAADKAIANAFSNRFYIPLDFELLESHMSFYQSALGNRLEYELTFNDYSRVIQATGDADASYDIENISLEYDMVTQPDLARMIDNQYKGHLAILYDQVLRYRKISKDKSDTLWNINLNVSARSMKGILMLFENFVAQQPFARNTETFCNPKITKVEVTIEGIPNQLFSQGMRAYQMWDKAKKVFAASPGSKRHPDVSVVPKNLALADVILGEFLTSKYSCGLTSGQPMMTGFMAMAAA